MQQLLQGLFVEALHVGVGQALPALGIELLFRGQGREFLDSAIPIVQLLGPVGPGLLQRLLITLGWQLRQPVMGRGRAAALGQARAVGLPQAHAMLQIAGGYPLLHLFSVRRILFDPGQAQVEQAIAVGRGIRQRLQGIFVALLLDQRLHQ
ncbi:hypothetical protein D3C78_1433170 [compost metagenome]